MKRPVRLAAAGMALCIALAVPLLAAFAVSASARVTGAGASGTGVMASASRTVRHVVIVGISGLTWDIATPAATGDLWRLARAGSVGSLVDYAQDPVSCPADGWLTLNSAARARGPRPCAALPAVTAAGAGAEIRAMPAIIAQNRSYHESPAWGLLGSLGTCATAVGAGAALALASPTGAVPSYLPSADAVSAAVLARCPLTVIDLGQVSAAERSRVAAVDRQVARIAAELPPSTMLLVTAPGAAVTGRGGVVEGPPHLMSVVVDGPGYAAGLLHSSATRHPGIVTLTDLTPTVAAWLGRPVPAGTVGARLTRGRRGALDAAVDGLRARDTAEQVWIVWHGWFLVGYGVAAALAFGGIALICRGSGAGQRRRRALGWRVAGLTAATVPLGSYLANLAPWWHWAHPAWWLYGMTLGWTAVLAAALLAGPWRRSALGPFGAACAATLLLLAVDVMSGSRLQLEAPFGLSLLVSGRFYGIGNDVLGVYCVSALVTTAWLAGLAAPRARTEQADAPATGTPATGTPATGALSTGRPATGRVLPFAAAGLVGLLAVVASGWPGFGAKVGGMIALVPCLLLLAAWLADVRVRPRLAVPIALSGVLLFLAFAVLSYFFPAAGVSDMGTFAGNLLHGRGGDLLQRKLSSNVGSLTLNVFGWLIPVAALLSGAALLRPAVLRLRTLDRAFAALPLLQVVARLSWLVLVIGWAADDSGVIVPAAALPFAVPLTIGMAAAVNLARSSFRSGSLGRIFW